MCGSVCSSYQWANGAGARDKWQKTRKKRIAHTPTHTHTHAEFCLLSCQNAEETNDKNWPLNEPITNKNTAFKHRAGMFSSRYQTKLVLWFLRASVSCRRLTGCSVSWQFPPILISFSILLCRQSLIWGEKIYRLIQTSFYRCGAHADGQRLVFKHPLLSAGSRLLTIWRSTWSFFTHPAPKGR